MIRSEQQQEYIISGEQLNAFEHLMGYKSEMRSQPLSEVLKAEWERGYNDGCSSCTTDLNVLEHNAKKAEREKVRPEVWQFALLMEKKLKENDHKKSWKKCKILYLIKRLKEEVKELEDCFWIEDSRSDFINIGEDFMIKGKYSEEDVIKECADVSNFAMMIAWQMRESLRSEP